MADFDDTILNAVRRGADLTMRQTALLVLLERHADSADARQPRTLTIEMGIPKPAVTRGADQLEKRGLIRRTWPETDRRGVLFTLTAAGQKFREEMKSGFAG